jgi:hypothetical protein
MLSLPVCSITAEVLTAFVSFNNWRGHEEVTTALHLSAGVEDCYVTQAEPGVIKSVLHCAVSV